MSFINEKITTNAWNNLDDSEIVLPFNFSVKEDFSASELEINEKEKEVQGDNDLAYDFGDDSFIENIKNIKLSKKKRIFIDGDLIINDIEDNFELSEAIYNFSKKKKEIEESNWKEINLKKRRINEKKSVKFDYTLRILNKLLEINGKADHSPSFINELDKEIEKKFDFWITSSEINPSDLSEEDHEIQDNNLDESNIIKDYDNQDNNLDKSSIIDSNCNNPSIKIEKEFSSIEDFDYFKDEEKKVILLFSFFILSVYFFYFLFLRIKNIFTRK